MRPSLAIRFIKRGNFADENQAREKIRSDVMHRHEDDVLGWPELQQDNAKRRLMADIKRPARFVGSQLQRMSFKLVRRLFLKIDDREHYRLCVFNYLHRLVVDSVEYGAQCL